MVYVFRRSDCKISIFFFKHLQNIQFKRWICSCLCQDILSQKHAVIRITNKFILMGQRKTTEYLKKQTQEKQQEPSKGKPQEKGNPSRPGQTLKPATLEMIRKDEEKKKK